MLRIDTIVREHTQYVSNIANVSVNIAPPLVETHSTPIVRPQPSYSGYRCSTHAWLHTRTRAHACYVGTYMDVVRKGIINCIA